MKMHAIKIRKNIEPIHSNSSSNSANPFQNIHRVNYAEKYSKMNANSLNLKKKLFRVNRSTSNRCLSSDADFLCQEFVHDSSMLESYFFLRIGRKLAFELGNGSTVQHTKTLNFLDCRLYLCLNKHFLRSKTLGKRQRAYFSSFQLVESVSLLN